MIPADLKYTKEHEWARIEGDSATVGITDYAQKQLGDITFVELPKTGTAYKAGDAVAVIESVKAAGDVYAPLPGKITGTNADVVETPELINSDPYGKGWIFKMQVAGVSNLMDSAAYTEYVAGMG